MSFPENDTEYQENVIDKVERDGDSFTITSDGWSLWCGKNCPIEPKAGQTARQYGRAGFAVRGLFIDGHKFWYRTPEQEDEHREIESYGADAAEWLARWDAGRSVWSIEMGGIGPGYEQCIQIVAAEVLRWLLDNKLDAASRWNDQAAWDSERERISAYGLEQPLIKSLGLSGAQWGAGVSLATRIYMDGPRKVMTTPEIQDRKIQVSKNFPSYAAA